jgi:hypothetical protein
MNNNMKRLIIILVVMIISCSAMNAEQLSPAQKKAKVEIFTALKKVGTNISEYNNNTIKFKYENVIYQASVEALNDQTLYLCLSVIFELPEAYISSASNLAAYNASSGKPVCSAAFGNELMFSCEMYAKDAKPFITVLPEMLQAIKSSIDSYDEEYQKLLRVDSQSSEVATSNGSGITYPNIYAYPPVFKNGDSRLFINCVTKTPQYTILDMISYNGGQYQYCSINKNSYIKANGKTYPLVKAEGIAYSPAHTDYPQYWAGHDASLSFQLYFPPLPEDATFFDFSEGYDGWQINGILLQHGYELPINCDPIETSFHTWHCQSIEIRGGQTIITKFVIPKSENTTIYSSQDEYIEDADTGRKYYLTNSSIGFENSPAILTTTIPTLFYELYPALPSTVKRINLSNGSQYYFRNMTIR